MTAENGRAARIVRFWRAVEMFSPQDAPKPTKRVKTGAEQVVLDLDPDQHAPWDEDHPLEKWKLPKIKKWQFTVYGGLYNMASVQNELTQVFGRDLIGPLMDVGATWWGERQLQGSDRT